ARADADAAQADKLKADAAVKTATRAVAEAVKSSQNAAAEAKTAVQLADEADKHAKDAKTQADTARQEADKAVAAAAKAAGFAHVTAQAAVDAHTAAQQVAAPANDAIQLGSPYAGTDSAAGLVMLTGQASKTIAEQQQAVADAHAKKAAAEAQAAKNLADQAKGDAKEAYQHAANAAQHASDARTYSKEALDYAAGAAKAASAAASSLARTTEYDRQATEDAEAADKAAGRAESHATDARTSADAAELDAEAARSAAVQAEQTAEDARAAADRADTAATEAEQAAKDAGEYAQQAQAAADRAEKAEKARRIDTGTVADERGSLGNVFYVIDRVEQAGAPEVVSKTKSCDNWISKFYYTGDCTITSRILFTATLDLYLCTEEDPNPQPFTCPTDDTDYLGQVKVNNLSQTVSHTITIEEFQENIDPVDILFGSWIKCAQKIVPGGETGSLGGCAWAAVDVISLSAGRIIRPIAEALRAVDAAFVTGVGVRDAFQTLKALEGVDAAAVAAIEREVELYEDLVTSCSRNSFPGGTQVLMADGTHRPIKDVGVGDLVLATDPASGQAWPEPVTDTFRHDTDHLTDITLTGGGTLTSTTGHRVYVAEHGWVHVSDLRVGDRLRTADGVPQAITALRNRADGASRRVFDLTVEGLHTFYVRSGGRHARDLLVHNCVNLSDEVAYPESGAHTLSKHVNRTRSEAEADARENLHKGLAPISTVWTNADVAQQAVDRVLAQYFFPNGKKNAARRAALDNFLAKRGKWAQETEFTITGKWDKYESLGTVYKASGSPEAAGNQVRVVLKRLPGKKGHDGFIVYTSYPMPKV
uniref:polymorphic toxin-type HINT domain-containing protein n=1 Tax=Streptomyces sp. WELS2 TaxID=2749435 RepID=UPI00215DA6A3